jgi:hypothetical protein
MITDRDVAIRVAADDRAMSEPWARTRPGPDHR